MRFIPIGIVVASLAASARSQPIATEVSVPTMAGGYSESLGVTLPPFRRGNFFFQPSPSLAGPPLLPGFGPPVTPSTFQFGRLRLTGGQSSRRFLGGTTAGVTTMDGVPGAIRSQTLTPFVTGLTPVVGTNRLGDTGDIGAAGRSATLSRIATANREADRQKLRQRLRRAERAEAKGDLRTARANYRSALPLAAPPLAATIRQRMLDLPQTARSNRSIEKRNELPNP